MCILCVWMRAHTTRMSDELNWCEYRIGRVMHTFVHPIEINKRKFKCNLFGLIQTKCNQRSLNIIASFFHYLALCQRCASFAFNINNVAKCIWLISCEIHTRTHTQSNIIKSHISSYLFILQRATTMSAAAATMAMTFAARLPHWWTKRNGTKDNGWASGLCFRSHSNGVWKCSLHDGTLFLFHFAYAMACVHSSLCSCSSCVCVSVFALAFASSIFCCLCFLIA